MNRFLRKALRGILAVGLTGTLLFASGCGGDDDNDHKDTTPDAFTFTGKTDVQLSTPTTSNAIIVNGINSPAPISVTGGTYSINGGTFTSTPGTVTNSQTVTVQQTSSAANSTVTTATLNIGGVSAPFTIVTVAAAGVDTTPDAFTFTAQTDVPLSTLRTSNAITVAGINGPAPISVTGGAYSINGGTYTSTPGLVTNGQTVTVQHTSSGANNTTITTTLSIGGISAGFTSTTLAGAAGLDTTPDAFTFTAQTGVPLSSAITSNAITVAGINGPAPISVTGGTYSINGGAFTSTPGTVTNGQTVTVQHPSPATNSTVTTTTLTIGGVSAPFTSTTLAAAAVDTTPDAFSFTAQTGVPLSTAVTSNAITVSGINSPAPISITGGTYSINGGAFTSTAGTVTNGQTVTVQQTSSAANSTVTTTTLTIGGVSAPFTITTLAAGAVDAAALYQSQCAGCHSLGTVDTTGSPNLSGKDAASRFSPPGTSHNGRTLSAAEITAMTAYFQAN